MPVMMEEEEQDDDMDGKSRGVGDGKKLLMLGHDGSTGFTSKAFKMHEGIRWDISFSERIKCGYYHVAYLADLGCLAVGPDWLNYRFKMVS